MDPNKRKHSPRPAEVPNTVIDRLVDSDIEVIDHAGENKRKRRKTAGKTGQSANESSKVTGNKKEQSTSNVLPLTPHKSPRQTPQKTTKTAAVGTDDGGGSGEDELETRDDPIPLNAAERAKLQDKSTQTGPIKPRKDWQQLRGLVKVWTDIKLKMAPEERMGERSHTVVTKDKSFDGVRIIFSAQEMRSMAGQFTAGLDPPVRASRPKELTVTAVKEFARLIIHQVQATVVVLDPEPKASIPDAVKKEQATAAVIPVLDEQHFYLVYVHLAFQTIEVYDSDQDKSPEGTYTVGESMAEAWIKCMGHDHTKFRLLIAKRIAQQTDRYSCGVYVLAYIQSLMYNDRNFARVVNEQGLRKSLLMQVIAAAMANISAA